MRDREKGLCILGKKGGRSSNEVFVQAIGTDVEEEEKKKYI